MALVEPEGGYNSFSGLLGEFCRESSFSCLKMASSSTTALDEGILKLVFLQEAATGRKAVVPLVEGVDWEGFLCRVRSRLGLPEGHTVQVRCLSHRLPWPLAARTALDERAHTRDAAEHSAAEQSALCSPYARAYPHLRPPPRHSCTTQGTRRSTRSTHCSRSTSRPRCGYHSSPPPPRRCPPHPPPQRPPRRAEPRARA